MVRVFVCADIEGTSGYVDPEQDADDRPAVRRAMTADVNAAVEGVIDADDDADVVVADSHGNKRNVLPGELHPAASLVRGGPRSLGMVAGVEVGADVGFLVGAHDRPGSGGHLEHAFTGAIDEVALDGAPVGEVELNALVLAHHGVPVGLVTGDDVLRATVASVLPAAEYVTTKAVHGVAAARCRHPEAVRRDVRKAAAAAVRARTDDHPVEVAVDASVEVSVRFSNAKLADAAALWPGVERGTDSRAVRYDAADVREGYQFVRATTTLSP